MSQKTIVTGSASTEDRALEWLKGHGAEVGGCMGLTVIRLPEQALVEQGAYHWQYTIGFYGPDGNHEDQYVEIEHYVDADETILRLKEAE